MDKDKLILISILVFIVGALGVAILAGVEETDVMSDIREEITINEAVDKIKKEDALPVKAYDLEWIIEHAIEFNETQYMLEQAMKDGYVSKQEYHEILKRYFTLTSVRDRATIMEENKKLVQDTLSMGLAKKAGK